ncbi:hypothetical protein [Sinorhizobium mexicanum]|uniref:Uncharacterized protein n=1 Tax=Sinorhizobium mexicanum TaxID=375549 RepID=A0A859QG77_9HYPH|nr:hypothetical protein [Sinorhizobium mexicanum]MBP1887188.1 hypothetical protein [Sinorhizobium mexicanum]QLL60220.1 hypothetical protein FKV68_01565 [Sinorhizobium mexicanum]
MKERILFVMLIFAVATTPISSASAGECDGDYYVGLGANQNHIGGKRQPINSYLLKRMARQKPPQGAAGNRAPN